MNTSTSPPTSVGAPIRIEVTPAGTWRGEIVASWMTQPTAPLSLLEGEIRPDRRDPPDGSRPTWTLQVGLEDPLDAESLRRAGGRLARWLLDRQATEIGIDAAGVHALGVPQGLQALSEGLLLGGFRFDAHKTAPPARRPLTVHLLVQEDESRALRSVQRARAIASGANLARAWAHEPPNVLHPVELADRARDLAARAVLGCTVLDETDLKSLGAGALLAVGMGSLHPPRLIVLEHRGSGQGRPVVVVGKAITFDTGGYSLKKRKKIVGMKFDKSGGMAVAGLLQAAADLDLRTPLVGVIAAAENAISERAYRPNDIIRTLSGKTVEIISTDAEGRLILADALTYAQSNYEPRALIDLATLTSGVVSALGPFRAGLMSNDDDLAQALLASGERVRERLWRLPLDEDVLDLIRAPDSDLKNSGGLKATPLIGGTFLKQFIDEGMPWAHLDIAGVAVRDDDLPYLTKGATGFGVRLLVDFLEQRERSPGGEHA